MAASSSEKRKNIYKVILLGNLGVGKTSMFRRLRDGSFHEHRTNFIGVDKHMKSYVLGNGEAVFLDIWDTAGMEGFRTVTRSYYNYARAAVFVYDVSQCKSFYDLALWMQDAQNFAPNAVPIMIGNKFDLEEDVDPKVAELFAAANGVKLHLKVSVKEDQSGVQEAFGTIAKHLHGGGCEHIERGDDYHSSIVLHDPPLPKKSTCGSCSRP